MSHGGRRGRPRRVERKSPPGVASKPSQVVGRRDSIRLVTSAAEALPDDTDMLKAMLLAERAESERLRQIIKELQRHRFGRRAESLPEEHLQLGLEDVEQVVAADSPFFHPGMSRVGWLFELAPNLGPLSARKSSFTG